MLILFGLVPIATWLWLGAEYLAAHALADAGARKMGQAAAILFFIVLLFTPAMIGGAMMVAGAALLACKRGTARIVAMIGAAIVLVWTIGAIVLSLNSAPLWYVAGASAYLLVLCSLIAWLWRISPAVTGGRNALGTLVR